MKYVVLIVVVTFAVVLLAPNSQGLGYYDTGAGLLYRLDVVKDVSLERSTTNFNYLQWLIVAKHHGFPNKRSLIQFENLPRRCSAAQIRSAKMYLYYVYAHKASWHSIKTTPFIPRYLEVRLVKKYWREAQATSLYRYRGSRWSSQWLSLDGRDAEASPQRGMVTIFPVRPRGFVEFDITDAVKSWRSGTPNYGLLIRATNELARGRDIRFASNRYSDKSKHAFVKVLCS